MCIPTNESNSVDVVAELTDNPVPRCGMSLVVVNLLQDQEEGAVLFNHIEFVVCEDIILIASVEDPDCLAVVTISRWVHAT